MKKQITGYMVVNEFNNPIVISASLPIYWRKKVAKKIQALCGGKIKKVKIVEL